MVRRGIGWLALTIVAVAGIWIVASIEEAVSAPSGKKWAIFTTGDLKERRASSDRSYLEFLDVPALNAGLYELPAGGKDMQKPHEQDELYYIVSGRGRFEVDGNEMDAGPGMVIYVKARVAHRFTEITEDLSVLVFFSTADSP